MSNKKHRILVSSQDGLRSPTTYVRLLFYLKKLSNDHEIIYADDLRQIQELHSFSFVVMARSTSKEALRIAEQAKALSIPLIYDIDDYLWKLPEYSKSHQQSFYLDEILTLASVITTPSHRLQKLIQEKFPHLKVQFVPNAGDIDAQQRVALRGVLANSDFFRLPSMRKDFFQSLSHAAKEANQEVILYYFSNDIPHFHNDDPYFKIIWCGIRSYPSYRDMLNFIRPDFALIPLQEDHFNQYKSVIKFAEFAHHGTIGIFSDVEPYSSFIQNEKNGFLAKNNPESWKSTFLKYLNQDTYSRQNMIQQNKEQQVREFSSDKVTNLWKELLGSQSSATVTKEHLPIQATEGTQPIQPNSEFFQLNSNAYEYISDTIEIFQYHTSQISWLCRQTIKLLISKIRSKF